MSLEDKKDIKNYNNSGIEILDEYKEVSQMINKGVPLIFVTGGAGTGKSTFIHWLNDTYKGHVIKSAPTGIAALNIEGKTIHSLFRLAPKFITPDDIAVIPQKFLKVYKESKVVIIDEISMVTSNMLDGVNMFLQKNLRNKLPFGGKTVVIVGDMFQLPPIVSNHASDVYFKIYDTAYFFGSKVMQDINFEFMELNKVRRQNDQTFIDVLSNIRVGKNITESIDILNSRCRIQNEPDDGAVVLSPRNNEVDQRNNIELKKIRGAKEQDYDGVLDGNFKTDRLPSPFYLTLKVGAQVQFTQNDPSIGVVNGTIGKVIDVHAEYVTVKVLSTNDIVIVKQAEWQEFDYRYDEYKKEVISSPCGTYKQVPLKLAWASTIHKSQGNTLDNVHIDLGAGCFATGQLYVALSRCRTIDGITLSRKLNYDDVCVDDSIVSFYEDCRKGEQDFHKSALDTMFAN